MEAAYQNHLPIWCQQYPKKGPTYVQRLTKMCWMQDSQSFFSVFSFEQLRKPFNLRKTDEKGPEPQSCCLFLPSPIN